MGGSGRNLCVCTRVRVRMYVCVWGGCGEMGGWCHEWLQAALNLDTSTLRALHVRICWMALGPLFLHGNELLTAYDHDVELCCHLVLAEKVTLSSLVAAWQRTDDTLHLSAGRATCGCWATIRAWQPQC